MSTPAPAYTLALDKRQRAMLKEMGVRVWSPLTVPARAAPMAAPAPVSDIAMEFVAVPGIETPATAAFDAEKVPLAASSLPATTADFRVGSRWQFDTAHALFADAPPQPGPRWLVLAEAAVGPFNPDAAPGDPLQGDAGQLLGNMLRAARLAHPGRAVLVPMSRASATPDDTAAPPTLAAPLAALIAAHQPDLVLVMGRLAAQALLATTEPLGKLRGRVHTLHGAPTVVTYDAQPLLRTPADKAKAWDDLCLGIATAAATQTSDVSGNTLGG